MSRLLKQVYSQNSSLRKYDKKPTKKIKCEAYCKHCINHHKRIQCSPSRESKIKFQSNSKLRRFAQNSLERPSEKSVISPCKTIKLSKQAPLGQNQDINALEMNIYRGLLQEKKNENAVLEKSQQDNTSSMEDQIFFNQFEHSGEDEQNKDLSVDQDFGKIEIPKIINLSEKQIQIKGDLQIQNQNERLIGQNERQDKQFINKREQEHGICEQIHTPKAQELLIQQHSDYKTSQNGLGRNFEAIIEQHNQQNEQIQQISRLKCEQIQESLPIQLEDVVLVKQSTSENDGHPQIIEALSVPQLIDESCLGESMMDKCLAFQGGRIYVDTSGQNFYISVRVFNKLRRRYSDIEQLTNVLIHQRPYLQSRKGQIKQELEEYLRTYI